MWEEGDGDVAGVTEKNYLYVDLEQFCLLESKLTKNSISEM